MTPRCGRWAWRGNVELPSVFGIELERLWLLPPDVDGDPAAGEPRPLVRPVVERRAKRERRAVNRKPSRRGQIYFGVSPLSIGVDSCGGRPRVIASIEEPELIERILAHRR
jgi:hypothetical protein